MQWIVAAVLAAPAVAWADTIRLQDGTEFSGTVVRKKGEQLLVQIPRAAVATLNGQPLPPAVAVGTKAPAFQVTDMAGASHTLEAGKGQVTLLKFWASWCPHCRSDVELMKSLYTKYQGHGFRLLTVSVDRDPKALDAFLTDHPLPYPVVLASQSPANQTIVDAYEVEGIPAYALIDGAGTITKMWSGSFTERKEDLANELTPLLPAPR